MKNLITFIQEGLKIGKDWKHTKVKFTDDELRKDYESVEWAMTKNEKKVFADKYNITTNKFRDIQVVILNILRENRQDKNKFDNFDVTDFLRFNIKEKEYVDYLDKEPIEFVKTLYEHYKNIASKRKILGWADLVNTRDSSYRLSIADKNILRHYNKIKKYLIDKHEKID